MADLKFYPEVPLYKNKKNGVYNITIRFDWKGSRIGADKLDITVKDEFWNAETKTVLPKDPAHKFKNQLISNRMNQHEMYFLKRRAMEMPVTKELVKIYLGCGAVESVATYAARMLETRKMRDGSGYDADSKRRYKDEIKRIEAFMPGMRFTDITVDMLTTYKYWLQTDYLKKDGKKLSANSVWKALSFLRTVYNDAKKNQVFADLDNVFKRFEVGSFETDYDKIKYLELSDLEALQHVLEKKEIDDLSYRVGWRYLSMCLSGLRISDAMRLNDAFFNDAGELEFKPHKTRKHGNKAIIPIVSQRQQFYLQKTLQLPLPETNAKNFRTTFNNKLKVLAAMAGLRCDLTSHTGRHTMGSFLVDAGVETKAAKAILGVKSDKVMQVYMHLKKSKLHSEADKLKNVF